MDSRKRSESARSDRQWIASERISTGPTGLTFSLVHPKNGANRLVEESFNAQTSFVVTSLMIPLGLAPFELYLAHPLGVALNGLGGRSSRRS